MDPMDRSFQELTLGRPSYYVNCEFQLPPGWNQSGMVVPTPHSNDLTSPQLPGMSAHDQHFQSFQSFHNPVAYSHYSLGEVPSSGSMVHSYPSASALPNQMPQNVFAGPPQHPGTPASNHDFRSSQPLQDPATFSHHAHSEVPSPRPGFYAYQSAPALAVQQVGREFFSSPQPMHPEADLSFVDQDLDFTGQDSHALPASHHFPTPPQSADASTNADQWRHTRNQGGHVDLTGHAARFKEDDTLYLVDPSIAHDLNVLAGQEGAGKRMTKAKRRAHQKRSLKADYDIKCAIAASNHKDVRLREQARYTRERADLKEAHERAKSALLCFP